MLVLRAASSARPRMNRARRTTAPTCLALGAMAADAARASRTQRQRGGHRIALNSSGTAASSVRESMRTSACVFTVWAKARGTNRALAPWPKRRAALCGIGTQARQAPGIRSVTAVRSVASAIRAECGPLQSKPVDTPAPVRAAAAALLPQLPPMAAISQLCASRGTTVAARHASDRMASSARTAEVERRPAGGRALLRQSR
jgi:hypothetical protein